MKIYRQRVIVCVFILTMISVLFFSSNISAKTEETTYSYNNFSYTIDKYQNNITITSYTGKEKKVIIPDKIKNLEVGEIGQNAFLNNKYITEVSMGNKIIIIDNSAFSGCSKLFKITYSNALTDIGERAFMNTALKEVVLPSTVRTIGKYAFNNCKNLTNVKLSKNIWLIQEGAFSNTAIKSISIPDDIYSLRSSVFSNCKKLESVKLPKNLTIISEGLFRNCTSLKKITLPQNVIQIEDNAFSDCTSLEDINFSKTLFTIKDGAFSGCTSLASLDLPDTVNMILTGAFVGCSGLTQFDLPDSLVFLGQNSFANCTNLKKVYIGEKLQYFDVDYGFPEKFSTDNINIDFPFKNCDLEKIEVNSNNKFFTVFNGCLYSKNKDKLCYVGKNIPSDFVLPESVEVIGKEVFYKNQQIKSIHITKNVKGIESDAFSNSSLEKVTFDKNSVLDTIGVRCFNNTNLKEIVLPKTVTAIDYLALADNKNLEKIYLSENLKSLYGEDDFTGDFMNNPKLVGVYISSKNKYFKSDNGVLYSIPTQKDERGRLIVYPPAKPGSEYTVLSNYYLGTASFSKVKNLKVIIKEGITSIINPFKGCYNLSVVLPRSIKYATDDSAGHLTDFPLFDKDCEKTTALVYKNSFMHKYCIKYKIPFSVID